MQRFIKIVGNGRKTARDLTRAEAAEAMSLIISGQATPVQVAAFMAALRIKEESSEELAGFTEVLRTACQRRQVERDNLIDLCLPYDGRSKAPYLTPAAACVAAAGGAALALHGRLGQLTPPKFGVGLGDVLEKLGIAVDRPVEAVARLIEREDVGLGFVSTQQFAPALEHFNTLRVEYGLRSFFNNIEKLLNPFGASTILAGVFHGPVLYRVASALQSQGYPRGLAVHGPEGSLDVLSSRITKIVEFSPTSPELQTWTIDPAEFGPRTSAHPRTQTDETSDEATPPTLTAEMNAALIPQLLDPKLPQAEELVNYRRSTIMSAALFLYAAQQVESLADGLSKAEDLISSGAALERLERWREASHEVTRHGPFVILMGGKQVIVPALAAELPVSEDYSQAEGDRASDRRK